MSIELELTAEFPDQEPVTVVIIDNPYDTIPVSSKEGNILSAESDGLYVPGTSKNKVDKKANHSLVEDSDILKLKRIEDEATKNRPDDENADKEHIHEIADVKHLKSELDKKADKDDIGIGLTPEEKNKLDNLPEPIDLAALLDSKISKETDKGLSSVDFSHDKNIKLEDLPTNTQLQEHLAVKVNKEDGKELIPSDQLEKLEDLPTNESLKDRLLMKVDKREGFGLVHNTPENNKTHGMRNGDWVPLEYDDFVTGDELELVLAEKADLAYVDAELQSKADVDGVAAALQPKADKLYVDIELEKKADKSDVSEFLKATDFKTINNESIVGQGNIVISGSGTSEQSDWNEVDTSSPAFIKNKPDLDSKADVTYVDLGLNSKVDLEEGKGLIKPAPVDGDIYGQKDGEWVKAENGSESFDPVKLPPYFFLNSYKKAITTSSQFSGRSSPTYMTLQDASNDIIWMVANMDSGGMQVRKRTIAANGTITDKILNVPDVEAVGILSSNEGGTEAAVITSQENNNIRFYAGKSTNPITAITPPFLYEGEILPNNSSFIGKNGNKIELIRGTSTRALLLEDASVPLGNFGIGSNEVVGSDIGVSYKVVNLNPLQLEIITNTGIPDTDVTYNFIAATSSILNLSVCIAYKEDKLNNSVEIRPYYKNSGESSWKSSSTPFEIKISPLLTTLARMSSFLEVDNALASGFMFKVGNFLVYSPEGRNWYVNNGSGWDIGGVVALPGGRYLEEGYQTKIIDFNI